MRCSQQCVHHATVPVVVFQLIVAVVAVTALGCKLSICGPVPAGAVSSVCSDETVTAPLAVTLRTR